MCGGYAEENLCMCGIREVWKDILTVMHFEISRLCTRTMLILLLIDYAKCRGSYNEILKYFFT